MNRDLQPKPSPVRVFQARMRYSLEAEDQNMSLSGLQDYEPRLEFDDTELNYAGLPPLPPELEPEFDYDTLLKSSNDGTIEENFEEELAGPSTAYTEITTLPITDEETFTYLNNKGVVEVSGDDGYGRRIITISACRLPKTSLIHPDKLLSYLLHTLDQYVEQDYSVVYFHWGLTKETKPPLSWFWKAYRAFDRKYKKNLKALYLVHPTNLIRIILRMLRPALSVKFGKKLLYVNYLHELSKHLDTAKLIIPQPVYDYDRDMIEKSPSDVRDNCSVIINPVALSFKETAPVVQFGVALKFILENNPNVVDSIPPIVRHCIEFLSQPEAIVTEGLFRRSVHMTVVDEAKAACNRGEVLNFNDPHLAAGLLKAFFRELYEPLLTFDLYEEIQNYRSYHGNALPRHVKILMMERLPIGNYRVLKYLMQFLWKVQDMKCVNKMTADNLGVVFGPNLIWSLKGQMNLSTIMPINSFTTYLIINQRTVFLI